MVIGLPLNSGLCWGILLAPFYVLMMNRLIIQHEETYLERKFGKAYTSYMSHVRRWL
jgi:protein-S-isoprenylcysteine O-methyltransferase Ste14